MEFKDFFCAENDSGRRLDKVVLRIFEDFQIHAGIFPLIRKGLVRLNDRKSAGDVRVQDGDRISIAKFLFESIEDGPSNGKNQNGGTLDFPINLEEITVFKNNHILILNKPAGINVQPSKDSGFCLCDAVGAEYKKQGGTSLSFRPGPLHRIDRGTSGLVAFSQSLEGARWFTRNIEEHCIAKTYLGIAEGSYENEVEKYVDPIEVPQNQGGTYSTVEVGGPGGKMAVTRAKFIQEISVDGNKCSLVEFSIETGRKHQIRAQSAFHGHPLLGDTAYGGKKIPSGRFFLHAWKLEFPKNSLGLPAELYAPCDFFDTSLLSKH